MTSKQPYKITFEANEVLQPIYSGGAVSLADGASILATALGDDAILTNPSNGKHLAKIEGDGDSVASLVLTPSGSHLIVCSRSLGMRIYRLGHSDDDSAIEVTRTRSLKPHPTPVVTLAVDRSGTLLATGGTDGVVKVWDIRGGFVTHSFNGPSGLVTSLHFYEARILQEASQKPSKNRKRITEEGAHEDVTFQTAFRLVSGTQGGKIKVWDLHKRAAVATLDSHVSDVTGLDYSPEQDAIVSASRDKTLTWWDAKSWKIRKIVPCLEMVEAAGFLDEGRLTYCAGEHGNLRYLDTDSGKQQTPEGQSNIEGEAIVAVIYRPTIPFILCVQADHTLALYQPPQKGDESTSSPRLLRRICGTHDEVIDMQYLLPDQSVMALATNSEEIRLISTSGSQNTTSEDIWQSPSSGCFGQDLGTLKGHKDIIITLDVDWSGYWVATGAKDNVVKLWRVGPEAGNNTCYATFSGHAESIGAIALPKTVPPESSAARSDPLNHPPSYLISGSQDQTIKKWEVPRNSQQKGEKSGIRALFTRKAHEKDINAIDIHPSGQLFASASQDKTVKIWSTEGEVQGILRGHKRGVWSVRFSPANLPSIQGEDGPVAGKGVILTASGDKTAKLWSLTDYTCIRTFEGHSNTVLKVVWLPVPEEKERQKHILFASAGGDGLVKVWNANSGEAECTLDNHEDRVWALAVNSSTKTLVSGSSDSTITFWKDTSVEAQVVASQTALRLVEQEQELENYIRTDSYREAITLALQLNHPGRLLSIFTSVIMTAAPEEGSLSGIAAVDEVLATLSDDQLFLLLLRLRDWNTNARTAHVAQRILAAVVRSYPASRISGLVARGRGGVAAGQRSVGEVLHALKAYTERHYKRLDELVNESYLIEYTLREMDALVPEHDEARDVVMGEALLGFQSFRFAVHSR